MAMQEQRVGMRDGRRVKLRLPARLIMPERGQNGWVVNLSETGAALEMHKPVQSNSGLLVWLDYRQIVDLIWQDHGLCGVRFVRPLDAHCFAQSVLAGKPQEAVPLFSALDTSSTFG